MHILQSFPSTLSSLLRLHFFLCLVEDLASGYTGRYSINMNMLSSIIVVVMNCGPIGIKCEICVVVCVYIYKCLIRCIHGSVA
jgi:hypothetical protein